MYRLHQAGIEIIQREAVMMSGFVPVKNSQPFRARKLSATPVSRMLLKCKAKAGLQRDY